MEGYDEKVVVWDNTGKRRSGVNKSTQLNQAMRAGNNVTEKRYGGGKNANTAQVGGNVDDEDGDIKKTPTVSLELKKALMQCRMKAKMSQKDLATACNLKVQIIQAYESGKGVPPSQTLVKIERALRQKDPTFELGTLTKAQKGKGKAKAKPKSKTQQQAARPRTMRR